MQSDKLSGIILCGGRSTRMGRPKALLPFGAQTLLERMTGILGQVCGEIVVVAANGQELPPLPPAVRIVYDRQELRGPLEGLRAGLTSLTGDGQSAYLTSCDAALLRPALVRQVAGLLGPHQVAAPVIGGYLQPLSAVYRRDVLPIVERLLAGERRALVDLLHSVDTRAIDPQELTEADPTLQSFRNLNTPDDYLAALAEAGFEPSPDILAAWQKHA
jgi:molybdopterin-guanine dinucleotide biosynthesis protein A